MSIWALDGLVNRTAWVRSRVKAIGDVRKSIQS